MPGPIDLTGHRFGRLVALEWTGKSTNDGRTWRCRCDCGGETVVGVGSLRSGHISACGCRRILSGGNAAKRRNKEIGGRLYGIWVGLRSRCRYDKHISYKRYGGRGIDVCPEWRDDFPTFQRWAIANGYRDDLTIDRINNDGPYCPDNCRFVTPSVNSRNRRSTSWITHAGETLCLAEWAERAGIRRDTLAWRLKNGWLIEDALATKPDYGNAWK